MNGIVKKTKKEVIVGVFIMTLLLILDQVTKALAESKLALKSVELIPGVFELQYLRNQSAAFSMDPITLLNNLFHIWTKQDEFLSAKMCFFYIFTILVIVIILLFFLHIPGQKRFFAMNLVCVLFVSGAIGNLIDRMTNQYVIDFLYFKLIDFPVFNVADIYVTVGAAVFIVFGLFYYKEEDFNQMLFKKKEK